MIRATDETRNALPGIRNRISNTQNPPLTAYIRRSGPKRGFIIGKSGELLSLGLVTLLLAQLSISAMEDKRGWTDEKWDSTRTVTGGMGRDCGGEHADKGSIVADGGVEISKFMEALANKRRRYVLYYLRAKEHAELEEVTEQIAAWETGTPPEELDEQTRRNVRVSLYHSHLPKLEKAGFIGYDHRHGSMRFQNPPERVIHFLDYCSAIESPEITR